MIDRTLYARIKLIMDIKQPKGVSVADVLAIIEQESNGVPIFRGTEPLFHANVHAATIWTETIGKPPVTARMKSGATEQEIKDIITIRNGPLKGMYSKFRFEYGYWNTFAKPLLLRFPFSAAELVLLSSSVGIGQQMLRFVVEKKAPVEMLADAYQFMGDINRQIEWVIGNLQAMRHTDKQLMYTRYNAGPGAKYRGATYNGYGKAVANRVVRIERELLEIEHV
jgi:hypothetical protein